MTDPVAIYSEIDRHAAEWLRQLVAGGHIAPGEVRGDIHGLDATELVGRQVHLFAGVGGWSLAFRLAGIPDDAPIWSGSCPCQPFSVAGKQSPCTSCGSRETQPAASLPDGWNHPTGFSDVTWWCRTCQSLFRGDVRHLWPVMRRLVADCLPPVVVGEQVASAAGRAWLDTVRSDLEALGYAVGAADLCAAGVGAPHIRQRLFWGAVRVGDPRLQRRDGLHPLLRPEAPGWDAGPVPEVAGPSCNGGLADGPSIGRRRGREGRPTRRRAGPADGGGMGNAHGCGWEGRRPEPAHAGAVHSGESPWGAHGWVQCTDGRSRPTAPIARRVDDGVPARVGLLRGYGNAIVPEVAAQFLMALLG